MNLLRNHIVLIRIQNLPNIILVYCIAVFINGGTHPEYFFLGIIIISSALFSANIINDLCDFDIDKKNNPSRPLPSGAISKKEAKKLFIYYIVVSLFFATFAGWQGLLLTVVFHLVSIAYSFPKQGLSYKGFLGVMGMAVGYVLIPALFGVLIATNELKISFETALFILGITLLATSQLLLKDFKDIIGDKLYEKITPLLFLGRSKLQYIIYLLGVLGRSMYFIFLEKLSGGPLLALPWILLLLWGTVNTLLLIYTTKRLVCDGYTPENKKILNRFYLSGRGELLLLATLLFFII